MKLTRKHNLVLANVSLLIIVGVVLWILQVHHLDEKRTRERAVLNAKVYAEEASKDFQRGVAITETLKEIVIDENGGIRNFETVAKDLMEDYIGSIQIAPSGVVSDIYPIAGNEAGKIDLLNNPNRGAICRYGKEYGVVTMQGPFNLAQGGQGIAIRNPVFLTDKNGEQQFWGFTIVIIKSPEIFKETFDALQSFDNDYTLDTTETYVGTSKKRVTGTIGEDEVLEDGEVYEIMESGNLWTITVKPTRGWGVGRARAAAAVAGSLGLLVILMTYMVLKQLEQKRTLREMAASAEKANSAKTNFLSNMAHDLRTPLNAVIGLTELTGKHLDDREKTEDYVQKIQVASNQLLQVINGILEITRIESNQVEINEQLVDTDEIYEGLETVFTNQAQANHLLFHFANNIEHRYLYVDRPHVEEILTNLVSNAMNFTKEDGVVDVRFTELPGKDKDHVIIRSNIKDNGIGMSEEFQRKLFEKFERENSEAVNGIKGTGLGLTIVKRLVDMMGGSITLSSRQGLGTLITVDLQHRIGEAPVEETGAASLEEADSLVETSAAEEAASLAEITSSVEAASLIEITSSGAGNSTAMADTVVNTTSEAAIGNLGPVAGGRRILLTEDNDINAMIAEDILGDEGFVIERACDGSECVEMVKNAPADYYDLILMDVNMPVMDGYTATRQIRALEDPKKASIIIIAMTAHAFEEDKVQAFAAGMNDHLSKPIDTQQLFAVIEKQEAARM